MSKVFQNRALAVGVLALALSVIALTSRNVGGADEAAKPGAFPRYNIVETQGHNLIVTDNATNTLYFYTIDKDAPIGSPVKLRASVDLKQVGQREIAPKKYALQK